MNHLSEALLQRGFYRNSIVPAGNFIATELDYTSACGRLRVVQTQHAGIVVLQRKNLPARPWEQVESNVPFTALNDVLTRREVGLYGFEETGYAHTFTGITPQGNVVTYVAGERAYLQRLLPASERLAVPSLADLPALLDMLDG